MSWCLTAMAIWSAVRMPNPIKVLLLGGTSEARMLAARLNAQSTLRQWAVDVRTRSPGVARAHGGAHAQSIALLAH